MKRSIRICLTGTLCFAAIASKAEDKFNGHVFVKIPGATYQLGAKNAARNPPHAAELKAFEIATTETTNAQFARFVEATGYKTDAEKRGTGKTFRLGFAPFEWEDTPGANWRLPNGPDFGGVENKSNHPVTQISYQDAQAYCDWAGLRLPTIDEWEVAARAGGPGPYYWGPDWEPDHAAYANTWDGDDYTTTTKHIDGKAYPLRDGYMLTAPVGSFKPNAWGLYDAIGNVFEYCADYPNAPIPPDPDAYPPSIAGRGGSWWCAPNSCHFHNLLDVGRMLPDVSISNQGFRVARDP